MSADYLSTLRERGVDPCLLAELAGDAGRGIAQVVATLPGSYLAVLNRADQRLDQLANQVRS